jgi:hypothetical protein
VFCRWNVLVRIKARALQLVGIVDQRSVLVQDLFDAEDDCRDLILEWRVSRGADHQAERAGARLAEAKERMLAIFQLWKNLNRFSCQGHELLRDLKSGPADLSCDDSARNLEFGSPSWPHFPWQQLFHPTGFQRAHARNSSRRVARIRPEVGREIRRAMGYSDGIGDRVTEKSKIFC